MTTPQPQPPNDPGVVTMTIRVPMWLAKPLEEVILSLEAATTLNPPPIPIRSAIVFVAFTGGARSNPGMCISGGGSHSHADSIQMLATMTGAAEAQTSHAIEDAEKGIEKIPGITPEKMAEGKTYVLELAQKFYTWGSVASSNKQYQEHEAIEIARASSKFKTGARS